MLRLHARNRMPRQSERLAFPTGAKWTGFIALILSVCLTTASAMAVCVEPAGDVNASGETDVVDVQCGVVVALWALNASPGAFPPACVGVEVERVDINCDLAINVVDVLLAIQHTLGNALDALLDADQDGCVDTCAAIGGGELPGVGCVGLCPVSCGDGICQPSTGELCSTCPADCGACWGAGVCCDLSAVPGCPDAGCEQCVCAHDQFCCLVAWDAFCVTCAAGGGCTLSPESAPDVSCQLACGCDESMTQSNCCGSQDTPGCDDPVCSDCVCAERPYCCETAWDGLCALDAVVLCKSSCQCLVGGGACCAPNEGTGCQNPGCQGCVCGEDPLCCTDVWDDGCSALAQTECNAVCECPADVDDCCSPAAGAGCGEAGCEQCVCQLQSTCCDVAWDEGCAALTTADCAGDCSCKASCCEESAATGCENSSCEACVCAAEPACCEDAWSEQCLVLATTSCNDSCECVGGECCTPHDGMGCTQTAGDFVSVDVLESADVTVPALTEVGFGLPFTPVDCELAVFEVEEAAIVWDFESDTGWTSGIMPTAAPQCQYSGWHLTSFTGGSAPISLGTTTWGTSNSGPQAGCENSFLLSPTFDITGGGLLSFDSFVSNEAYFAGFDLESVEISYDGGQTFSTLVASSDPIFYPLIPPAWAHASGVPVGLAGATEASIRFHYDTVDGLGDPLEVVGWFIDNVQLDRAMGSPVFTANLAFGMTSYTFASPGSYVYGCIDTSDPLCATGFFSDGMGCLLDAAWVQVLPTCEQCVCAADDFCCDTSWDSLCVGLGSASCGAECGCEGGCCSANSTASCDNAGCAQCVCSFFDAKCCTDVWTDECAAFAEVGCEGQCECGPPPSPGTACCGQTFSPGCANAQCESCVCGEDSFCCNVQWDEDCVVTANGSQCAPACLCPPQGGECCTAHATGGCDNDFCSQCVCDEDDFCCDINWDQKCVDIGQYECFIECGCSGPCCESHPNAGCDIPACEECVCLQDLACCFILWDGQCASKANADNCAASCECQ